MGPVLGWDGTGCERFRARDAGFTGDPLLGRGVNDQLLVAENVDDTLSPVWDVYYLYGPDAEWTDDPGPLISSGGTIIGRSSELQKAITPLLTS